MKFMTPDFRLLSNYTNSSNNLLSALARYLKVLIQRHLEIPYQENCLSIKPHLYLGYNGAVADRQCKPIEDAESDNTLINTIAR